MNRKLFITIMFVSVSLIVLILYGCSLNSDILASETQTTETVEPVATTIISREEILPVDEKVTLGEMVWEIKNVEDKGNQIVVSSSSYSLKAVRGRFIFIQFALTNNGEDIKILYDLNVIDSKGRVYTLCLPAYANFTDIKACAVVEVLPGTENIYDAPFDVSPDSYDLVLEVTDLKVPYEKNAYIDLGI